MYIPEFTIRVPIERLITNLEREVASNKKDFLSRLNLGRLYAMAYSLKTDTLETKKDSSLWFGYDPPRVLHNKVTTTEDIERKRIANEHLEKAIYWYKQAAELSPDDLVIKLGYAWCLDQAGRDSIAKKLFIDIADESYKREKDRDKQFSDVFCFSYRSIAVEAYKYALALLDSVEEKQEIRRIKLILSRHNQISVITPIVFPLNTELQKNQIINHNVNVNFDLDGTGKHEWNWISPDACWLVHDKDHDGIIDSGRDLFGSITFWLFWRNGYDALRALDDNGDGELRGSELVGLAGWQDGNSNGISESGEVKTLDKMGVIALSCSYKSTTLNDQTIWVSKGGVTFANGNSHPTYDIILEMKSKQKVALITADQ